MVDVHCHLNFKAFENDLDEVIKQAFEAGVTKIINVGAQLSSSKRAVDLAKKHDPPAGGLYATVGIHPHHADKLEESWEIKLEKLASSEGRVVAIGECGMDFYAYQSKGVTDSSLQKEVFIKQIEIAHKLKLPLMIHNRHAGKQILDILLNHKSYLLNPPGMFHCMSGDIELLKKVLDLGFYIGFDGNITYKGIPKGETAYLKDLVKFTPLDRILTETDSPYLTPEPHRGSRNNPSYVILVGSKIAEIKNISFEKVKEQTILNANAIFQLS